MRCVMPPQFEHRTMTRDRDDLGGTTLNEQLFLRALFDEFDEALEQRNRDQLIEILERVEIRGSDAAQAADEILEQR